MAIPAQHINPGRSGAGVIGLDGIVRDEPYLLCDGLLAGAWNRALPVLDAWLPRARARNDEPLRARLQPAVFQRWLPHRASCRRRCALDSVASAGPSRRESEPLAGGPALARCLLSQLAGTPGSSFENIAAIRSEPPRASAAPTVVPYAGTATGRGRGRRTVSAHRAAVAATIAASESCRD